MSKSWVNSRVQSLQPSGIRKFFDIVAQMQDVVSLGVGEPDFPTPWHVREEGIYVLEKGMTTYTSNAGLLELRREVSRFLAEQYGLEYRAEDQILITIGASEAIDLAMRTVLEPGDEVLIPEPSFVSYAPCAILAGGVPVAVTTTEETEFRLTPDALEKAITEKAKVLVLPYPNNPTGAILERSDLEALAKVICKHDLLVVSDEIYSELTYGTKHVSIASLPGMAQRTIVINGFSKAFSMTGWRLGYAAGDSEIIAGMTKVHQFTIMCSPTVSQYAAIEALRNGMESVKKMRNEYDLRRRFVVHGFRQMGLECFEPKGAFYVFPSIKSLGLSSEEFCSRLLQEEKVAVVPGTAFGSCGEGYIRCSYAYSLSNLEKALTRIGRFVKRMRQQS
ncbi:MAG: aminotransferase class I/II-fold pyridoxal phosphate-dependent enzyme [Limnochordia bacterium]|mgnify:FL=1|jgi:aminotransferase|nr:aminotransferase class I/II-fold pyridoxal phosphate-dependent enzyme [Bacillota bacterium]HOB09225.1 aminotransferase class I/II-fold pyridoxal phosphate-dependent enzyme [Limnochordia bacterium]NLH31307.1 aminotransferase class I/II-fold pyridoxal phosphate-dependent enzyme [Bacillota bacterium]HPT93662.1 aminotransferase class I/II-fold pyridoxal phosphate-dependent enzyme [Limnochordia bacterium]HPZ30064.1 aminotransferase class I/II-fold pyridoxal phosphate-dependent enzyme [Limnochordi